MPSPDFIDAYERKQWTLRIGAFAALGLAVAGFATFGIMQGQARDAYGTGSLGEMNTFLSARNALIAEETEANRKKTEDLASRIQTQLAISYVAVGIGLASAVTATVLFLVGEDPNRYQSYRGPKASAWLTPQGGGAGFSFDF
jgi:hypothetical protein